VCEHVAQQVEFIGVPAVAWHVTQSHLRFELGKDAFLRSTLHIPVIVNTYSG